MYLKNIVLKNIGPVDELSVKLPFNKNRNPKPVIFVGENGSGKTILQAQIVDSLYEIGSALFDDVGHQSELIGLDRSYYKISGGASLQIGKSKGFSLLRFVDNDNQILEYFDKGGALKKEDFTKCIAGFSLSPDNLTGFQKKITRIDGVKKEKFKNEWREGVHFYQPADRYEEPFWKNKPFFDDTRFEDEIIFSGNFGKELEIISSTKKNKSFLLDLVLDYTIYPKNIVNQTIWESINSILRKIKKRDDIEFGVGPRGRYRVGIDVKNPDKPEKQLLLPSIDNLSLGESILLNLFINIVRHGDTPPKLTTEIKGIVAIDEIDVHLHTNLQHSVLPKLIKLFPKVQFIITTHSPLFLFGMEEAFGKDGFQIIDMPKGEVITTERFSEFEKTYSVLEKTAKFENDIKERIASSTKPTIYVEGPTDVQYIERAYDLHGKDCTNIDIEMIGEETASGTIHGGSEALKNAENFLSTNLNLLEQKVILLHDPEKRGKKKKPFKGKAYSNLLYIRKIRHFEENPLKKGIENLFGKDFIDKVEAKFPDDFSYRVKAKKKDNFRIDSNKKSICDWICKEGTKEDFKNFKKIFTIINKVISDDKLKKVKVSQSKK